MTKGICKSQSALQRFCSTHNSYNEFLYCVYVLLFTNMKPNLNMVVKFIPSCVVLMEKDVIMKK